MAANSGDFKSGGASARGDEIGIIKPVAETTGAPKPRGEAPLYIPLSAKEAARERARGVAIPEAPGTVRGKAKPAVEKPTNLSKDLQFYTALTGKKAVSMDDTMAIAHHLTSKLEAAHASLTGATSVFKEHPNLEKAGRTLGDVRNLLTAASVLRKQEPLLTKDGEPLLNKKGNPRSRNETSAAWEQISKAGNQIQAAHRLLHGVSPEHVADIQHNHILTHDDGSQTHLTFTPQNGLNAITAAPGGGFRAKGRDVNEVRLAGRTARVGTRERVNLEVRKREQSLGISGVENIRPEAERAFRKKISPQRRVRKTERTFENTRRIGPTNPKSDLPLVQSLGEAAVQPSKVGDWGGSERALGKPESVINKVDRQAQATRRPTVGETAKITKKGEK